MEKIRINSFAGLKELELGVSRVTGLVGPQASGKSIIAKLLYFFREIASGLPDAVIDGLGSAQYKAACCKRFSHYFPADQAGVADFEITYLTGKEQVRVSFSKEPAAGQESLGLEWSDFYPSAIETLTQSKQELFGALGEADERGRTDARFRLVQQYDQEATKVLGPWSSYEQMFIPAGRAFFSQFRASVFRGLQSGGSLDPFMVAFGSLLEQTKWRLETDGFFDPVEPARYLKLRSPIREILHAELGRAEKEDFLQFDDGRRVRLAQASSGEQEAWPLLLLLARFLSTPSVRGRAVYIEEPEAHLFPSTQKQLVELMARVFRCRADEMCLLITTHSPYILTSINNLLQAGKLYAATRDRRVPHRLSKIVPGSFRPGEVGFYALEAGTAKSILDRDTGLIDAAVIDQVSNDIAIQFDKLLAEGNEKP